MVATIEQLCIKSFEVEAGNGDRWKAEQGKVYITTVPKNDNEVMVFSDFWVRVPKSHFVGVEEDAGKSDR